MEQTTGPVTSDHQLKFVLPEGCLSWRRKSYILSSWATNGVYLEEVMGKLLKWGIKSNLIHSRSLFCVLFAFKFDQNLAIFHHIIIFICCQLDFKMFLWNSSKGQKQMMLNTNLYTVNFKGIRSECMSFSISIPMGLQFWSLNYFWLLFN